MNESDSGVQAPRLARNGSEALLFKWMRQAFTRKNLWKLYWLEIFAVAYLVVLCAVSVLLKLTHNVGPTNFYITLSSFGTLGAFLVSLAVRLHSSSLPCVIALQDLHEPNWPFLGSTPITAREIHQALLMQSLLTCVVPFTAVMQVDFVALAFQMGMAGEFPGPGCLLMIMAGAAGLASTMAGLSLLFGLSTRSRTGAIAGAAAPVIFLILVGLANLSTQGASGWVLDRATLFAVPEAFYMYSVTDTASSMPSGEPISVQYVTGCYWAAAVVVWLLVYLVVRHRRLSLA